jgi:regulator of cell morphogenesis and NO signaling
MNQFTSTDKLASVIHANHFLLPVINRFGIKLGFKDKTVEQVCAEQNIDQNFFLAIVNTYTNPGYFPESALISFSPLLIVNYLRKTHQYYFDYFFPEVERRLEKLLGSCQGNCSDLYLIKSFYEKYKDELSKHLREEDEKVFPYVIAITNAVANKTALTEPYSKYSIKKFEQEHNNVDQKIFDLKNIIIKYLEPSYNVNYGNELLFAIFRFERDLLDHARIEDKILSRQVQNLEKLLHHE